MIYLFASYFINEKGFVAKKVNAISFNTFKVMMINVNLSKRLFKEKDGKLITVTENLYGSDTLWKITFTCSDKEIREQAGNFLVSINSQVKVELLPKLAEKFYNRVLKEALSNKENIVFALKLINDYIKGDVKYSKIDKLQYLSEPLTSIKVEIKRFDKKLSFSVISINQTLKISHLRNAISAVLKLSKQQFKLKYKKSKVIFDDTHNKEDIKKWFYEGSNVQLTVEELKPSIPLKNTPLYIISNNEEDNKRLLKLLKDNEELAEQIWKVMKELILTLSIDQIQNWDKRLNPDKNIHNFLWNIYALKRIVMAKEFDEENILKRLIDKGLIQYLIEKYKELIKELEGYIKLRLINYIAKILYTLISL
jgi:hypothetical protein